ncbi:unnamed protein product [Thelazia callipaeda]|uniref:RNase_Zc3h12a domain-containing protein n=1 Tax=Thelazia callipaeda TaxID=103827 RepID=A0A0N5D0B5_THECL|nr:unnamed protein product [Thelazia callipaeda]
MYPFDRLREQTYMKPCESAIPRLIVIDGSNIARSSCGTDREDLDVVVFLPVIYNNNYNFNATNAQVLPKLRNLDVLTFTPARAARSGRSAFINYDDLYILEFAERHGGNVLSGDRFYDIAKEYTYRDYRQIIKERRIDVIFRPLDADFVEYGRDRFFRFLPELRVLRINGINSSLSADERMQRRLYCLPSDKDYNKVVRRREFWTSKRRDEIVSAIDVLLDEIATKNCLVPKIIPVQIPSSSKTEVIEIKNSSL